jgi:signal transduction histidine kinase
MNRTPLTREQEKSFNRIVLSAVLIPILVMVIASILLAWVVSHLLSVTDWVDHTDKVVADAIHCERLMLDSQAALRGFLLTTNEQMLQTYNKSSAQVGPALDALSAEVNDNPSQVQKVKKIAGDYKVWKEHADKFITRSKQPGNSRAVPTAEELALMNPMMQELDQFIEVENGLRAERSTAVQEINLRITRTRWVVLLVLGAGIAYYVRRQLQGVARLYDAALLTVEQKSQALQVSESSLKEAQAKLRAHANHLERTVTERTAQLRETVAELEAYSYSVSHDLRAPLRAVRGYAHVLQEDFASKLDPKAQDFLKRMMTSCDRMDALIQDVLSYSRLSRADLKSDRVDLERLIQEILQQYPALQAADADVKIEGPLPVLNAPEALLSQCLSNLLNNAVKFTRPGVKPDVRVRAETHGYDVRIWVEDKGIGIDPQYHERIFGVFERIPGQPSYDGTGIGLAIVRKAVERMGGKVGLVSELGKGSRFWIDLPGRLTS